jgi:hypothetical protein
MHGALSSKAASIWWSRYRTERGNAQSAPDDAIAPRGAVGEGSGATFVAQGGGVQLAALDTTRCRV